MADSGYGPGTVSDGFLHGGTGRARRAADLQATLLTAGVLLGAVVMIVIAGSALPGPLGPGLGMIAVGGAAALVLFALNRPVLAVSILLFCAFLRLALKSSALPVEPAFMAMAVVLAAAVIAVTRRVNRAPSFGPLEGAMALFVFWNIASGIVPHTYPAGGIQALGESYSVYHFILTGTLMPFILYVVGRFVFDREAAIRAILWVLTAMAAYSVWVSFAQFYAPALVWPRYILDIPADNSWASRAVGVFVQPVANGLILIAGFGIAVHLLYDAGTRRWQRIMLAVLLPASLVAIYMTYTRVVWGCFAILAVLGAIYLRRGQNIYRAALAGIVLGILVNMQTFFSSDRSSGGIGSSYEVEDRLNMWATAFWAIGEKPWFGWGVGTFSQVNTYHHQQWPGVPWFRGFGIVSHMTELGMFAELGLIGLSIWLTIVFLTVRNLRVAVRTISPQGLVGRDLAVLTAILYTIWVITGYTADLRFFEFMGMTVLLLVGIVVGAAERQREADRHRPLAALPDDEELLFGRSRAAEPAR